MKNKRYSFSTIKTYKSMFEEFINYYPLKKIDEINEKQIIVFLRYLVEKDVFPIPIKTNLLMP